MKEKRSNNLIIRYGKEQEHNSKDSYKIDHKIKNKEFEDLVTIKCVLCGEEIKFEVLDSCPTCGFVKFRCRNCDWFFNFGE